MQHPDPDTYPWRTSREAAERMHDAIKLHFLVLSLEEMLSGRWVAIRLSDGGSDNTVYDTRADAMRFQLHPTQCLYLRLVPPAPPPATACDVLLWYVRGAYDRGWRPDENVDDLIFPHATELIDAAQRGPRRN